MNQIKQLYNKLPHGSKLKVCDEIAEKLNLSSTYIFQRWFNSDTGVTEKYKEQVKEILNKAIVVKLENERINQAKKEIDRLKIPENNLIPADVYDRLSNFKKWAKKEIEK